MNKDISTCNQKKVSKFVGVIIENYKQLLDSSLQVLVITFGEVKDMFTVRTNCDINHVIFQENCCNFHYSKTILPLHHELSCPFSSDSDYAKK